MNDLASLALVLTLVVIAVLAYRFRVVLQPHRAAAYAYFAGLMVWGVAVFGVWWAWSAQRGCEGPACGPRIEVLEQTLDEPEGDIPPTDEDLPFEPPEEPAA